MATLLLLDRYDVEPIREAARTSAAGEVLLLNASPGWWRLRGVELPAGWSFVDQTTLAADAVDRVQRFAVDVLRRLDDVTVGDSRLADLLAGDDGQMWWWTEASETSPFRTPLISRLYALALVECRLQQHPPDNIVVAIGDVKLRDVLVERFGGRPLRVAAAGPAPAGAFARRYWSSAAIAVGRTVAEKLFAMQLAGPEPAPAGALWVFTFYPSWWTAPQRRTHERFFSSPGADTRFVAWLTSVPRLWRERAATRDAVRAARIVPLQNFVRWREIAAIASVSRFRRIARAVDAVDGELQAAFAGFDVAPLLRDDIRQSLSGGELFQSVVLGPAIRRFADACRPRALLFRAEFQPSEQVIAESLHRRTATVGFIHYPFGERYLPMRLLPRDSARLEDGGRDGRPLPDAFIASGAAGVEHLAADGVARRRLSVCGPQRLSGLMASLRAAPGRRERATPGTRGRRVFVSLATIEADTEALFAAIVEALPELGGASLVIRTHPNRPSGDDALTAALAAFGSGAELLPAEASLYESIAACDLMIALGSTIAFEAIALGVMPVVFQNPGTWPANSLEEFSDAMFVVDGGERLGAAVRAVLTNAPAALEKRTRWPSAIARAFGDLVTPLEPQLAQALAACGIPGDARMSA